MFKRRKHAIAVWSLMLVIGATLSACGGGGGGGGGGTTIPLEMTAAPSLSKSSVQQGGSIKVTVPVTSSTGYVGACLASSLLSAPNNSMCGGGAPSGNSVDITITVPANATVSSTYYVVILTCATMSDCTSGNGMGYASNGGSNTYYSVQYVSNNPVLATLTDVHFTIPTFSVTAIANPGLPGMTAAPSLSVSSVAQGGTIDVTVPVTPVTVFVGACLSTSLAGSTTTMCGGGAPVSNSTTFTINIDPAATPASTYYVWVLTCANLTDCGNNTGTLYASNNSSTTYYSASETNGTTGTFSDTGYPVPQFSITSSGGGGGGGGGGTGVIPGGITAAPVITPSSSYPGSVINVTVPVTSDTGWVKVCTKSAQIEFSTLTTNYGCGDAAAISNSASINVTLSNSAPLTSTYWVTLLACSTQADCSAGNGLGYSLVNIGGNYSSVYYSATTSAGTPNLATLAATVYTIPYFSVVAAPVSTSYATPTAISLSSSATLQVGAGATGYVTFTTKTSTFYGIYVTDQSNLITALALSASYDDGAHNPVAVTAADGLSQNNLVTLGFSTDATAHTYVVKIDNSAGANPVTFSIQAVEATSGGTASGSAVPLALRTPVYLGADATNGWFSFVPDNTTATMTLSNLTHGMNVDLVDSNGSTVLYPFSSSQDIISPQNPFQSYGPLTMGNTYYLHVTSQSLVSGAPTIGSVVVQTP